MSNTAKKICSYCGKPYQYQNKVEYKNGKQVACWHDNEYKAGVNMETQIAPGVTRKKLKNYGKRTGQTVVEGSDGIVRIMK